MPARKDGEGSPGNAAADSAGLNARAVKLMDSGKAGAAVPLLEAALSLNPGSALLRLNLASALRESGQAERALDVLDTIGPGAPTAADARVLEGLIHAGADRPERAEASYLAALEADPSHRDAWNDLGVLRFLAGRFAEARDCFEKALAADPGLSEAWFNLADACRETGDAEAAARADAEYERSRGGN